MSKKVVTFGEIMLRLSTPGYQRFVQAQNFDIHYGGGEANVAVSLANYGLESYFITRLPAHEIGQAAVNHLRRFGVRVDYIVRDGQRIGIYFVEKGASQRPSKVIYDRANAAVATIKPGEIDWAAVFEGAAWFHWTGITPALGKNSHDAIVEACRAAKAAGVTVSCDLNYRKKLWAMEDAEKTMQPLMEYVDVCIANEEDAQKSLGMPADQSGHDAIELDESTYTRLSRNLKERYGFQTVAITLRESYSASRNGWSAMLLDDKNCRKPCRSRRYDIQIVDRIGGGDAFASGLIFGLLTKANTRDALEFAVAASCLKQTIPGDFNLSSVEEIEALVNGNGAAKIER